MVKVEPLPFVSTEHPPLWGQVPKAKHCSTESNRENTPVAERIDGSKSRCRSSWGRMPKLVCNKANIRSENVMCFNIQAVRVFHCNVTDLYLAGQQGGSWFKSLPTVCGTLILI